MPTVVIVENALEAFVKGGGGQPKRIRVHPAKWAAMTGQGHGGAFYQSTKFGVITVVLDNTFARGTVIVSV